MSVTPQQLSRMTIAHNIAAIDEHLAREDRAEIGDETMQITADLIWNERVADPSCTSRIKPELVREGLTEIMGTADDDEMRELAELAANDTSEFGNVLADWLREFWAADCTERARERIERQERRDRDDAAAGRMGY